MVPLPGNTMEHSRNNQNEGSGVHRNHIAAQLAAIITKLEPFESLKADIAFLKVQRLKPYEGFVALKGPNNPKNPITGQLAGNAAERGPNNPRNPFTTCQLAANVSEGGPPKNRISSQLAAIAARIDALESRLREDFASLNTQYDALPDQVKEENCLQLKIANDSMVMLDQVEEEATEDGVISGVKGLSSFPELLISIVSDNTNSVEDRSKPTFSVQLKITALGLDSMQLAKRQCEGFGYRDSDEQDPLAMVTSLGRPKPDDPISIMHAGQPLLEWLVAWHHNSLISDLRASRVSGRVVLIRTRNLGHGIPELLLGNLIQQLAGNSKLNEGGKLGGKT